MPFIHSFISTENKEGRTKGNWAAQFGLRNTIKSWLTHSNNTSHDNWHNTLHHQVGSQNGHG